MKSLLAFAPLLRPHLKSFGLALLASLVALAAGTALLGVSGWFLTATALTALGVSFNLFAPSAAVRGLSFIRILARYGEKLAGHNATLLLLSDIRRWLFAALFPRLPLDRRQLRHGDLVSRLTGDVDALDTILLVAVGPLVGAVLLGGTVTAALVVFLPEVGWLYAALLGLAVILVPGALAIASRGTGSAVMAAVADLRIEVLDAVSGHDDIVLFDRHETVAARFAGARARLARLRQRQAFLTATATAAVQILTAAALLATLWLGLSALEAGRIDGPVLAGLVFAVIASFEVTGTITRTAGRLATAVAAAERLQALASLPPATTDLSEPASLPEGSDILLEDVRFAYDTRPVLDGIDMCVAPGERVLITGSSGCGKSTLLDLIARLDDVDSGRVRIANTDVRSVALADLHARIVFLRQDSPVFLDTVRNNLLIANPDAGDADLWEALEALHLAATVRALPDELDTLLGEDANTLSAGQARRLCLARTMLSPAPIVLLDEPTVGLDRETERSILEDLPRLFPGRTVVMATHAVLPADPHLRQLALRGGKLEEPSR